jgi:hypothetical protein
MSNKTIDQEWEEFKERYPKQIKAEPVIMSEESEREYWQKQANAGNPRACWHNENVKMPKQSTDFWAEIGE